MHGVLHSESSPHETSMSVGTITYLEQLLRSPKTLNNWLCRFLGGTATCFPNP